MGTSDGPVAARPVTGGTSLAGSMVTWNTIRSVLRIWSRITPPPNLSVWALMYWLPGVRNSELTVFNSPLMPAVAHEASRGDMATGGGARLPEPEGSIATVLVPLRPVLMTTPPLTPTV